VAPNGRRARLKYDSYIGRRLWDLVDSV